MYPIQKWLVGIFLAIMALISTNLFFFKPSDILVFLELIVLMVLGYLTGVAGFSRFTDVEEGTAKIVVRRGKYRKMLLTKKGYKIGVDEEIVPLADNEEAPSQLPWWLQPLKDILGGLQFVGWWPLDKVYTYNHDWIKINSDGTAEDRHEENVDFTLVRDYVYGIRVLRAEDSDLIPLDVLLSVRGEITNPFKWHFRVKDGFRTLVGRTVPYVRDFISEKPYEKHQREGELEQDIKNELTNDRILKQFKEEHGLNIKNIEVVNIDPGEEFRRLTVQRRIGRMNAWQAIEETAGRVLESAAKILGLPVDTIPAKAGPPAVPAIEGLRQKIMADPKLRGTLASGGGFKEAFDFAEDQVKRDRAGEKGDLTDIRVGGTSGEPLPESAIIGGLAAIFKQKGKSERVNPGKRKTRGKNKDDQANEDEEKDWDVGWEDENEENEK